MRHHNELEPRILRHQASSKEPFDIDVAMKKIREAIRPYKKAMLFELADKGHTSVFEQLVACLISIRTYDEVSLKIAEKLFTRAKTPKQILKLPLEELADLLRGSQFAFQKAATIRAIAKEAVDRFGGEVPCDEKTLLSFKGVGPKCTNLVLGIACRKKKIGVDVHVHRVTNRWGLVTTTTPGKTLEQLEDVLPKKYWVRINELLVPFGKHICKGVRPACPDCPLLSMCQQVGVTVTSRLDPERH